MFVDLRKTEPDALLSALQEEVGRRDPRFLAMEVPTHFCPRPPQPASIDDDEPIASLIKSFQSREAASAFPEIDEEFNAEVDLLRRKRNELRSKGTTNGAQADSVHTFDVLDSANAANAALADWDTYALPYRLREGLIVEIRSPDSWASLRPTVKAYRGDSFLAWMTKECALLNARVAQLQAQRRLLFNAVALLVAALVLRI
ncbi:hypothetical protein [Gemmatimonas sp.]